MTKTAHPQYSDLRQFWTNRISKDIHLMSIIGRFLVKIGIEDKCWIWKGSVTNKYGVFGFEGKAIVAHRLAYRLFVNSLPDSKVVYRRCKNSLCCNPKHLVIGDRGSVMDYALQEEFKKSITKKRKIEKIEKIKPTQIHYGTSVGNMISKPVQKKLVRLSDKFGSIE